MRRPGRASAAPWPWPGTGRDELSSAEPSESRILLSHLCLKVERAQDGSAAAEVSSVEDSGLSHLG